MGRYLTIFEVSGKQNYIFSSNKLAECIESSDAIAYVTSAKYIQKAAGDLFSEEKNLVYSGGGHTILEFETEEAATEVTRLVTYAVMCDYPRMDYYAKTIRYDDSLTPGKNVKKLTAELEKKKSIRRASFRQGSFGIEVPEYTDARTPRKDEDMPGGYICTYEFEKLGISKGESGFIAVVHIDGNAMGKRVEELSESGHLNTWESYKECMRDFSEGIAADFQNAYREMKETVASAFMDGRLSDLNLRYKDGSMYFPVRKIISEGDDICFVSEGRIGIECAAQFIKALAGKTNAVDQKPYSACAGVAIVHQKYPFYRAYELAEELCSNAKKFGAGLCGAEKGSEVSSIDWHIEYGELMDDLDDTRKQYDTADGKRLELKPYIISAPSEILEIEPVRQYKNFLRLMRKMMSDNSFSTGRLKEMRTVLKNGEDEAEYYMTFHKIRDIAFDYYQGIYTNPDLSKTEIGSGEHLDRKLFVKTGDGKTRSLIFDAIEAIDVFVPFEEE